MPASGFFERAFSDAPLTRLIDEDPDLFADLPPNGLVDARARAVAPAFSRARGPWAVDVSGICDATQCLGLLVLDGLLVHSIVVASEPRSEVVGPGDLLRPWDEDGSIASVRFESEWDVIQPARIAVLDGRAVAFAARWPQFMLAVISRTVRRSHWLALQMAINDLRRVDDRLLLFLWHLADRWGRVRPDGVHVPLPVTHDVLAQLVCAQRPTVTSALRRLTAAGLLTRRRDRTWLLAPDGQPEPLRRAAPVSVTAA
ncbi:MAG TPA: Crp/Fnr family transcriptional regulator [Solirubrobacteraceae bacterium]|nr:Crp/Fnr family transcriptional regulator [Solirubrobacteraceae bacterium]